ncbi:MAG: LysE family translocator, partial [Mesorhizobium sp.]
STAISAMAIAATGGIIVGGMVHTLNGAIGVGLLMHFVPILFRPLLLAGAAYMAFIGITLMRSSITVGQDGP